MALVLNDEQRMLRDAARSFFVDRSPVVAARALRDRGDEWSPATWTAMAEMGWAGIAIPEEYSGLGFGYVGAGLICEEAGRTLAASPLVSSALVCAALVTRLGSGAQKQTLLPAIAGGELILALALEEGSRFDPLAVATTAAPVDGGFVLDGSKLLLADAGMAQRFIVVARTGGRPGESAGLGLFLLDRDAAGLSTATVRNLDNRIATNLRLESVRVDADAVLGPADGAWPELERALDIGAACLAAELLGVATEAFERTLAYLKERKQFGAPIGSFQALQHRAARLYCELELSRSAVLKALQSLDADDGERSLLASAAKAKCSRTAQLAVNEAVQMHGGIGMTDDLDIGLFMKRAAAAGQRFGDAYYHAGRFAQLRGY